MNLTQRRQAAKKEEYGRMILGQNDYESELFCPKIILPYFSFLVPLRLRAFA
jgi:hypothetical protein